jgi:nicotinamide mononucleotide transporter
MAGRARLMEMSPLEVVAALLGVANVALLWRRSIWNYPFGMAMVALYMEIFWEARLYAEAGLQVFFFAVNNYGWVLWLRNGGADGPVAVEWMTSQQRRAWGAGIAALSLSLGWLLHRYTNAALPFVDASVAAASVAAQFMLSFRKIENWVLWIVIDVVSIGLYINRGLLLTAGLYVLLLGISALGLKDWMAAEREGRPA